MSIKFISIPTDFVLDNWKKAIDFCDDQTEIFCYCGRLATGFHTSNCKQFLKHVQNHIVCLFENSQKGVK